jgi:aspartyl-tRNA(Asn)/glutamyl-tRNA(Gln) amidotransferase subunit B
MIKLIEDGIISGKIAKEVLVEMYRTGEAPAAIIEEKGLIQISDSSALEAAVAEVLAQNPAQVEEFRSGKERVMGFLVGQIMKATQGKANPKMVNDILRKQLAE